MLFLDLGFGAWSSHNCWSHLRSTSSSILLFFLTLIHQKCIHKMSIFIKVNSFLSFYFKCDTKHFLLNQAPTQADCKVIGFVALSTPCSEFPLRWCCNSRRKSNIRRTERAQRNIIRGEISIDFLAIKNRVSLALRCSGLSCGLQPKYLSAIREQVGEGRQGVQARMECLALTEEMWSPSWLPAPSHAHTKPDSLSKHAAFYFVLLLTFKCGFVFM